jgi:hypothetical protein
VSTESVFLLAAHSRTACGCSDVTEEARVEAAEGSPVPPIVQTGLAAGGGESVSPGSSISTKAYFLAKFSDIRVEYRHGIRVEYRHDIEWSKDTTGGQ